nr:MAG TPA: hypothetical protein [Bacteriophage sp.]
MNSPLRRSVQFSLLLAKISTRISSNWLIHREAPGTAITIRKL